FLEVTGYKRDQVIGYSSQKLGIWEDPAERNLMLQKIHNNESIRNLETRFRTKSGEIRTFLTSVEIIDMDGEPHLLFVTRDISDRKQIEKVLRLSEESFSKAFNASPVVMCITTLEEGLFINVNDSFCRFFGYSRKEAIGRTYTEMGIWDRPLDRSWAKQMIIETGSVHNRETKFRKRSGEIRFGLFSGEKIEIDGQLCLLSIVVDITERKQAEEDIKYLSFNDKLTGVYNRAYFEEELKRIDVKRQVPISLIMGDVNGLKLINEALGRKEGDKLLKHVAKLFRKSCRKGDIVARWGGDEFIILLPGCENQAASKVLDRIRSACKQSKELPIQISISLGLASKSNYTKDMQDVIKEAEDKMYRNKLLESKSIRSSFINSLENTLWTRSHETKEHCTRMQVMAQKIGRAIDISDSELDNLRLLAALHDIGKIAIPNSILDKPGKLSLEEWESIKKHPEIGYRIALSSPELAAIAEAILNHHERWDGTGYPSGLKGNKIPLISRIIAIIDTYDVMINGRPYQTPFTKEQVLNEITRCAGSQFDPELAKIVVNLL
ncbi:MAG: HD domain-containing phosphohydrolase, partial [Syntrophomonas sp.]